MKPIPAFLFLLVIISFFVSDNIYNDYSLAGSYFAFPFIIISILNFSSELKTNFFRYILFYLVLILFLFIYWSYYDFSKWSNLIGPVLVSFCAFNFRFNQFIEEYFVKLFIIFVVILSISFYFGLWEPNILSGRFTVLRHNENYLSHLLSFGLILTLYQNFKKKIKSKKYLFLSFLILVPLFSTGSRTGLFISIFAIILYLIFSFKNKNSITYILVLLMSSIALAASNFANYLQLFSQRLMLIEDDVRGVYIKKMFEVISEYPITGIGLNKFYSDAWRESVGLVFNSGNQITIMSTHNSFIDLLLIGGILVLFAYCIILFYPIKICFGAIKKRQFSEKHYLIFMSVFSVTCFGLTGQIVSDKFCWFLIGFNYLLIYKYKLS